MDLSTFKPQDENEILKEIKEKGTDESFYQEMIKFEEYLKIVNIDLYNELDRKYMFDI